MAELATEAVAPPQADRDPKCESLAGNSSSDPLVPEKIAQQPDLLEPESTNPVPVAAEVEVPDAGEGEQSLPKDACDEKGEEGQKELVVAPISQSKVLKTFERRKKPMKVYERRKKKAGDEKVGDDVNGREEGVAEKEKEKKKVLKRSSPDTGEAIGGKAKKVKRDTGVKQESGEERVMKKKKDKSQDVHVKRRQTKTEDEENGVPEKKLKKSTSKEGSDGRQKKVARQNADGKGKIVKKLDSTTVAKEGSDGRQKKLTQQKVDGKIVKKLDSTIVAKEAADKGNESYNVTKGSATNKTIGKLSQEGKILKPKDQDKPKDTKLNRPKEAKPTSKPLYKDMKKGNDGKGNTEAKASKDLNEGQKSELDALKKSFKALHTSSEPTQKNASETMSTPVPRLIDDGANKVRAAYEAAKEMKQRLAQKEEPSSASLKFLKAAAQPKQTTQSNSPVLKESTPESNISPAEYIQKQGGDAKKQVSSKDREKGIALETFQGMLETLTRAKESIQKTTLFAMDCAHKGIAKQVMDAILRRLKKEREHKKRVDLLFLVDSMAQYHHHKGGPDYASIVEGCLDRFLTAVAPPNSPSENRQQCVKVVNLWVQRNIMKETLLKDTIARLGMEAGLNTTQRQYQRHDRAFHDPMREMGNDMFVDEYGSNTSFQLPGFLVRKPDEEDEELEMEMEKEMETNGAPKHNVVLEEFHGDQPEAEFMENENGSMNRSWGTYSVERSVPLPPLPPPSPPPLPASPPPSPPRPPSSPVPYSSVISQPSSQRQLRQKLL